MCVKGAAPAATVAGLCLLLLIGAAPSAEPQTFSVSASTTSVEKGEEFILYLRVRTDEVGLHRLTIRPELPLGFTLAQERQPPEIPDPLEAGSSFVFSYRVRAPGYLEIGHGQGRGISTRDPKNFIFNLSYRLGPNGPTRHHAVDLTLRYTTSIYLYLVWGIVGLLLAHVIKSLAKHRGEAAPAFPSLSNIIDYVFVRNLVGLATTLAIGFAVLVILARDTIPIRGWYDSFALGAILGMLGDEDLLGKLKIK